MSRLLKFVGSGLLLVASALLSPALAEAQSGPAVTFVVESINDLRADIRAVAEVFAPFSGKSADDVDEMIDEKLGLLGPNMAGIDPARPIGLLGTIEADLMKSNYVVAVPIKDEKAFRDALEMHGVQVAPGDAGTSRLTLPNGFPQPITMKIANEHAYIAFNREDVPATLPKPKELQGSLKGDIALLISPKNIPSAVLDMVKMQIDSAVNEAENTELPGESPEQKQLRVFGSKVGVESFKTMLDETNDLGFRISLDAKSGKFVMDFRLIPKPETKLAGEAAKIAPGPNRFTSLRTKDEILSVLAKQPIDPDQAALLPPGPIQQQATMLVQHFDPKGVELIFSLRSMAEGNGLRLLLAISLKDSKATEDAIRPLAQQIPLIPVQFDAGKAGDAKVHHVQIPFPAPGPAADFTSNPVCIAFHNNAAFVTAGKDSTGLMTEAVAAKTSSESVPPFTLAIAPPKILEIIKMELAEAGEKLGQASGENVLITATGGQYVTSKIELNIKDLAMLISTMGRSASATFESVK